jgi:hypothetical protein
MNKVLALLGALVLAVIAYTALSPQSANDEGAAADVASAGICRRADHGFHR